MLHNIPEERCSHVLKLLFLAFILRWMKVMGRFDLDLHFLRFEDTELTVACYRQGSYGRFGLLLVSSI